MYKEKPEDLKYCPPKIPKEIFKQLMIMYQRDEKGNHIEYTQKEIEEATNKVKEYWSFIDGKRVD